MEAQPSPSVPNHSWTPPKPLLRVRYLGKAIRDVCLHKPLGRWALRADTLWTFPGKHLFLGMAWMLSQESIGGRSWDCHGHTGSHSRNNPPRRILRNLSGGFLKVIVTQRLSWNISASLGSFHRGAGSRQAAE